MSLFRYFTWLTAALLPVAVVAVIWGPRYPETASAVAFGAGIAHLNAIAAYGIVRWARPRSVNVFLGAVLGGMLGRMVAMLVGIVFGIRVASLPALPLVAALILYFIAFLVLELRVLPRQVTAEAR